MMMINSVNKIFKIALIAMFPLLLFGGKSIAKEHLSYQKISIVDHQNKKSDLSFFYHNETSGKKSSVSIPFSLRKKGREENNDVLIIKTRACVPFEFNAPEKVTDYQKDVSSFFVFLPSLRGPPVV